LAPNQLSNFTFYNVFCHKNTPPFIAICNLRRTFQYLNVFVGRHHSWKHII